MGTISKLVKTCILRITEDKVFFILSERIGEGGAQIWCELPQVGHDDICCIIYNSLKNLVHLYNNNSYFK